MTARTTNKLPPLANAPPSCSLSASKLLDNLNKRELVSAVSQCIEACISANRTLLGGGKQDCSQNTRFHAKQPPPVSVEAYLWR